MLNTIGLVLIYAVLFLMMFFGAKISKRHEWNEEVFSLNQMKMIQGASAVFIMFHHMAQKTCASWNPPATIVHGLDIFVDIGYWFVSIFLFCSGFGLYKSVKNKENYLKGFVKARILPIIIAFYASEILFFVVRLLMHEKMNAKTIFFYLIGFKLANYYGWFVVALPLFYLIFYLAFRFCKKDGVAIFMTGVGITAYVLLGTAIDHNDYLMKGEWWYNTAYLFVIGILFARFEKSIVRFFKKIYPGALIASVILLYGFYILSVVAQLILSYYCEWLDISLIEKMLRRYACALSQVLTSSTFVILVFLVTMKIKIGNKVLKFFGGITLETYLVHGIFVELFGFNFLGTVKSLYYIKNVPLFVLVVLVCSVPSIIVFKKLLNLMTAKLKK